MNKVPNAEPETVTSDKSGSNLAALQAINARREVPIRVRQKKYLNNIRQGHRLQLVRNRHCPKCQSLARAQWLERRQADLLPVPYFHVVFTVPQEIAAIAFQNKRVVHDILFQATAETLQTIAADPRHLGATIGFIALLHTWGQNLVLLQ